MRQSTHQLPDMAARNQLTHCYQPPLLQAGFSLWILLPWLLLFTLAAVFWWFVEAHGDNLAGEMMLLKDAQVAPAPAVNSVMPTAPVLSYHDTLQQAALSVVNIYTTQKIVHPYANDPMFREFLEFHGYTIPENDATNLGSGVIVADDGYIVTNAHVVEKADEIVVALADGRKARAKIIGSDKESDLAVIKIDLDNLRAIDFKKEAVQVGDVALAIGNPFGVGQTVTQGIVSATGRTGLGMNTFEEFVQTDAAINPGNSGGALVDANGALIGINTMIYSRSGGSMGIGFAIPTAVVEKVMTDIISTGKVSRGWLGIEVGHAPVNPASLEIAKGVVVASVLPGAPGDKAGLQTGDVVMTIDGVEVTSTSTLIQLIARKSPGSQVVLGIERDGKAADVVAKLAERPSLEELNAGRNLLPQFP